MPSVPPCRLRRLLTGSVVPLLAVGCAYLLIPAFGHAIWYDESYSVALTSHGWSGIWNLGSLDVHPIGYYMLLNLVRLVFGEHVVAYRLMSAAASCALVVAGYAMMRRDWGARRTAVRGVGVLCSAVHAHGVPDPHVLMGGAGRRDVLPVRDAHLHQGARQWARARERVDRIRAVLLAGAYRHYYAVLVVTIINAIVLAVVCARAVDRADAVAGAQCVVGVLDSFQVPNDVDPADRLSADGRGRAEHL